MIKRSRPILPITLFVFGLAALYLG
jgi:hypothetical protein